MDLTSNYPISNKEELNYDVSVIIPVYNGEKWIDNCFSAILNQTALKGLNIEICVCNDASNDQTENLLQKWTQKFKENNITLKIYTNTSGAPKGVGYGKNKAIEISSGQYLCFQDIDDIMLPNRILKQYETAKSLSNNTLLGSKFERNPPNSTLRYTKWANSLTENQLNTQIFTSNGPTVIMPTWFCHREVFDRVGKFSENGKGTPEDLIFFYKHIDLGGKIARIDDNLLIYQYHPNATTFSIDENTIWNIRLERLETNILSKWTNFTIWNAGKQGRKLYKSLKPANQEKVIALCDVDKNKIGKSYEVYDEKLRKVIRKINIVDFKNAAKPFVICVKLDMTDGSFEDNLNSLNLQEGKDFIHFS